MDTTTRKRYIVELLIECGTETPYNVASEVYTAVKTLAHEANWRFDILGFSYKVEN